MNPGQGEVARCGGRRTGQFAGVVLLALMMAAFAFAQSNGEASREADGILLNLRSDREGVTVDWRFLRSPPAPVRQIEVNMNGQPLGRPATRVMPFPANGQTAILKVLIDSNDASASDARSSLSRLTGLIPTGVEVKVQDLKAGSPTASGGASDSDVAGDGDSQTSRVDLASALEQSIEEIGARAADRRAILVFPDTKAGAPFSVDALSSRAKELSIAIFVIKDKERASPDFAAFESLSQATNGGTIDGDDDLADALSRTFLSGAELRFPFGGASRYIWQATAVVTASLLYGDRKILVALEADPPAAGWRRSAEEFWKPSLSDLPAFVAGALLMLAALVAFRFFRRPRIF